MRFYIQLLSFPQLYKQLPGIFSYKQLTNKIYSVQEPLIGTWVGRLSVTLGQRCKWWKYQCRQLQQVNLQLGWALIWKHKHYPEYGVCSNRLKSNNSGKTVTNPLHLCFERTVDSSIRKVFSYNFNAINKLKSIIEEFIWENPW